MTKRRLELSPQARRDLRTIRLYGLDHWGMQRANRYRAALRRGFERVRDNPMIGKLRGDLDLADLRSLPVEHHVVYYRLNDDAIEIARILHQKQDAFAELRDASPR